jgi:hypothetical protein
MEPKHIVFFVFALVVGCDRCYGLRLTSATGESHRLSQAYVRTYGCESFADVSSADDMIAWCEARNLGDTVSSDVAAGCRPGESVAGCERFWVCE